MTVMASEFWPLLDEPYNLEIYPSGWKADDELEVIELGERVSDCLTDVALGQAYSRLNDRIWAAAIWMYRCMIRRRDDTGLPVPPGWTPDAEAWDEGRLP